VHLTAAAAKMSLGGDSASKQIHLVYTTNYQHSAAYRLSRTHKKSSDRQ